MKDDKYLPIGSVVNIKGSQKRIMIIGFCAMTGDKPNKIFDYSGCTYPEGLVASNKTILFDHDQIEKICCKGPVDNEEIEFKKQLKALVAKIENVQ